MPERKEQLLLRARQLAASRRYQEARAVYQTIIDVEPRHAGALREAALVNLNEGRVDAAIRLFRRALIVDPGDPDTCAHLGEALWRSGEREWALACFVCALASGSTFSRLPSVISEAVAVLVANNSPQREWKRGGDIWVSGNASFKKVIARQLLDEPLAFGLVQALSEYCGARDFPCREIRPSGSIAINQPSRQPGQNTGGLRHRVELPPLRVAEVYGAGLTRAPYILTGPDGIVLTELYAPPLRHGEPNSWPGNAQDHTVAVISNREGRTVLRRSGPEVEAPVSECISLVESGDLTWFNWVVQIAPKLMLVESFAEYDRLPLLVGSHAPRQGLELLKMLDTRGRDFVFLESFAKEDEDDIDKTVRLWVRGRRLLPPITYRFERLVIPSPTAFLSPYRIGAIRPDDHVIHPDGIMWLRKRLLPQVERTSHRRVYLSRAKQSRRRLLNEDEIASLLIRHSFELVFPEQLSFRQQLEIFANAEVVVGVAGSAMTGMIFAPPGCIFILFVGNMGATNLYPVYHMAELLDLDLRVILHTAPCNSMENDDDFSIEPNQVQSILSSIEQRHRDEVT